VRKSLVIDPRIKAKPDDILPLPVVVRVTEFTEAAAKAFAEDLEKAHHTGQPVIPVVIDSYGGVAYSLLDMIAQIQVARLPVVTVAEGKAMSCGACLFAMGNMRYAAPHATLMFHDVWGGAVGKIPEIKAGVAETERVRDLVYSLTARSIGQPADFFVKEFRARGNAEWYMTARQAKQLGIATHIGVPELVCEVGVKYRFGARMRAKE